jgi:hypothetical protein
MNIVERTAIMKSLALSVDQIGEDEVIWSRYGIRLSLDRETLRLHVSISQNGVFIDDLSIGSGIWLNVLQPLGNFALQFCMAYQDPEKLILFMTMPLRKAIDFIHMEATDGSMDTTDTQ